MKIKVCGLKDAANIAQVDELNPDLMGFIFYPPSKRFVSDQLPTTKNKRIGVFVNAQLEYILTTVVKYNLQGVQLHGFESPEFCKKLKDSSLIVIKSFAIDKESDFELCNVYAPYCDYFLFDKKCVGYGGSGEKFDWSLLNNYKTQIPFFLSGGIKEEDIREIQELNHPWFVGVDLNSGFEDEPGIKNILKLSKTFKILKR